MALGRAILSMALLALAASVYAGLSPQDIMDVEKIALQRQDFFGDDI